MRKLLLIATALILGAAYLHAESSRDRAWRSSNTATSNLFNAFVASGSIRVKMVSVNTASVGSYKLFRGSKSTDTAIQYENIDTNVNRDYPFDVVFSSGLMVGKSGAADVTLIWDWDSGIPTVGREGVGRR